MIKKNDQKIEEILGEFVKQKQIAKGYNQQSIQQFWEERMGTMINRYTKKIRLRNQVLIVEISSSPLKQELNYNKQKIMNLLQDEFHGSVVKEIRFL